MPLAHSEGGLTLSMTRGATAAGTVRTYVLADRITRASCFVCADAEEAIALGAWIASELPAMQAWLESSDDATLSRHARLREVDTHVVGPDVPHALGLDDRRRGRAEHDHPQRLRAQHGLRHAARAPASPSVRSSRRTWAATRNRRYQYFHSGHGKTVIAEAFLPDEQLGRRAAHERRRTSRRSPGRAPTARSPPGMQSVAFTPASAVAAIFAATGQDLGMVGTSSMAHGTARRVERRPAGLDPLPGARGRDDRRRHDAALGTRLAGDDRLRGSRPRLPLRADRRRRGALPRDQRLGLDGDRRQRELLHAPTTQRGGLR